MLIRIKIPKYIMNLKDDVNFTQMQMTFDDKEYVITKELLEIASKQIDEVDYKTLSFNLPDCWIEPLMTVDSILNIDKDDFAVVLLEAKGNPDIVVYKHNGWKNKYFIPNVYNVLKPIRAHDLLHKLTQALTHSYSVVSKYTKPDDIKRFMIAKPINIIHKDIFADEHHMNESNSVVSIIQENKPYAENLIYITHDFEVNVELLRMHKNVSHVINRPKISYRTSEEIIKDAEEFAKSKNQKNDNEQRLEALMSIQDDPSSNIEIDLINRTVSNRHVRKQNQIFRASKADYAGQAIKFKGMCVHHGLSNNGIEQNLIKMPRNLTFLKIRVNGWKNNRIATKDFAFNKEGLLSAMVYRDNNTTKENAEQLTLNPYIKRFIELIGAEEFVKLYDVTPNFNHLDVGNLIVKRFFKKDVELSSNITNKVKNILPRTKYAQDLLDTMPAGFLIFIKTRWCVNEKKLDFKIIRNIDTAEMYPDLPKEAIGSHICLVNGDPIYFSNDYDQLDTIVNIIAQYITKIVNIYKGDYKEISE